MPRQQASAGPPGPGIAPCSLKYIASRSPFATPASFSPAPAAAAEVRSRPRFGGARRTIAAQFYFSQPGAVADTLAAILIERRRAGVRVLLLLDAFGSQPLKGDWVQRLRSAGVEVAWLRPLHWYTLHKADQRSHVRSIVVDGRVGYTGGFGLADYWLGDGLHPDQWRESNVRVRGTAGEASTVWSSGAVEAEA